MDTTISQDSESTIWTNIDFSKLGKQIGTLNLPYSPDDDAYGFIPIPIAVINGGDGPTVLMTGGVHGDEYEGPIVLNDLIRTLQPEKVKVDLELTRFDGHRIVKSRRSHQCQESTTPSRHTRRNFASK